MREYVDKIRLTDDQKKFVADNLGLIIPIVRSFNIPSNLEIEDVYQEGAIGLCIAVSKFNPDLGFKISTYARWWIKNCVRGAIYGSKRLIRLPERRILINSNVRKIDERDKLELGEIRSAEDVAEELDCKLCDRVTPDHVVESRSDNFHFEFSSVKNLDGTYDDACDKIKSDDDVFDNLVSNEFFLKLEKCMKRLKKRERKIFEDYYYTGKTMREIGEEHEISKQRVEQIISLVKSRIDNHLSK